MICLFSLLIPVYQTPLKTLGIILRCNQNIYIIQKEVTRDSKKKINVLISMPYYMK